MRQPGLGGQAVCLVLADLVGVAQGQADIIQPVEQAVLAERLHVKRQLVALVLDHDLAIEVDGELIARAASGSTLGNRQFLQQVVKKMSAKLGAMTARKPYWSSAQGACSREEPQPKFLRASRMLTPL